MAGKDSSTHGTTDDEAEHTGRRTGKSIGSLDYVRPQYPHNIHPALVPGIGIDEQRRHYRVDKVVFTVAGALTVAFVIWGIISPSSVSVVANGAYSWATTNLGWLFNAVAIIVLVALLWLALSRYGKIPLGKDGEDPGILHVFLGGDALRRWSRHRRDVLGPGRAADLLREPAAADKRA